MLLFQFAAIGFERQIQECACPGSSLTGDPHIRGAHGDRADFKEEDNGVYAVLSARHLQWSVRLNGDTYRTPYSRQLVIGSWARACYWVVRTATGGRLRIAFEASSPHSLVVTGDSGNVSVVRGPSSASFEGVQISILGKEAAVSAYGWRMRAESTIAYPHPNKVRLNLRLQPTHNTQRDRVAAHDLLGQTYDGDGSPTSGKGDDYRKHAEGSPVRTRAQAEGTIEGVADDYRLAHPFATEFRFSRFEASAAAVRDPSALRPELRPKLRPVILPGQGSLSPFPPTRQSPLHQSAFLQSINLQGGDLRGVRAVWSAAGCRRLCLGEPRCVAFTFITAPSAHRPCWLKRSVAETAIGFSPGCVSGFIDRSSSNTNQIPTPSVRRRLVGASAASDCLSPPAVPPNAPPPSSPPAPPSLPLSDSCLQLGTAFGIAFTHVPFEQGDTYTDAPPHSADPAVLANPCSDQAAFRPNYYPLQMGHCVGDRWVNQTTCEAYGCTWNLVQDENCNCATQAVVSK